MFQFIYFRVKRAVEPNRWISATIGQVNIGLICA
jgi:hypothetical protein